MGVLDVSNAGLNGDPLKGANTPASGAGAPAAQPTLDPFGLTPLLARTAEILRETKLDAAVQSALTKVLDRDLLSSARTGATVDPYKLAQIMAESPVISELLDRRARAGIVLGGTLQREDFHLIGAVYMYAKLVLDDALLAADMTLLHSGAHNLDFTDIGNKLAGFYKRCAAEPESPLKHLLKGEFEDSNSTAASALVAGMIAPAIVMRHKLAAPKEEGLWKRLTSRKPKLEGNLGDLGVIEALQPEDGEYLRELSRTPTKRPVPPAPPPVLQEVTPPPRQHTSVPAEPRLPPAPRRGGGRVRKFDRPDSRPDGTLDGAESFDSGGMQPLIPEPRRPAAPPQPDNSKPSGTLEGAQKVNASDAPGVLLTESGAAPKAASQSDAAPQKLAGAEPFRPKKAVPPSNSESAPVERNGPSGTLPGATKFGT